MRTFDIKKRRQSVKENNYGINSSTQHGEKEDVLRKQDLIVIDKASQSVTSEPSEESCNVSTDETKDKSKVLISGIGDQTEKSQKAVTKRRQIPFSDA